MFTWLAANLASVLVGLVLLAVVILAVRKLVVDRRAGRHICGGSCGGNCAGCAGCGAAQRS